jgi:hypothetical protein
MGCDVGHVGDARLVRSVGGEVALEDVGRDRLRMIRVRHSSERALLSPFPTFDAYEALDARRRGDGRISRVRAARFFLPMVMSLRAQLASGPRAARRCREGARESDELRSRDARPQSFALPGAASTMRRRRCANTPKRCRELEPVLRVLRADEAELHSLSFGEDGRRPFEPRAPSRGASPASATS